MRWKSTMTNKVCLIRYDVEKDWDQSIDVFLETIVKLHKENSIPATFFFTGKSLEKRSGNVKKFYNTVKDCNLFDIQNHSYAHIGIGYDRGKPLEILKADYVKSFKIHEEVLGVRPVAISMCGTGGVDGERLHGFDQTLKARDEFEMLAGLGVKAINTFLCGLDESRMFTNYGSIGHPEIMGFPSGFSDTSWLWEKDYHYAMEYILKVIEDRGRKVEHMPLVLHDWVTWEYGASNEFEYIKRIADKAREMGFELLNIKQCYETQELWG